MTHSDGTWNLDDELTLIRAVAQQVADGQPRMGIRLLLVPQGIDVHDDEVLVQRVDQASRSITVVPKKVADLDASDVLYESSVVDPTDTAYLQHAEAMRAAKCLYRYPDGKNHQGIYE